jgi:hypothetical protein
MINHIWSVLCESSILDQDTKLISMINVLEELAIPDEPAPDKGLQIVASLVTLWVRSEINKPSQGFARYNFTSPSGNILQSLEQPIDLTKYERLRSRGQFVGLNLPESGQYFFNVEFRENEHDEWRRVAAIPLKVNFKKD